MTEAVQTLKRQRVRMILVNLAYFMVLLLLGVLLFLQNDAAGVTGYLLVAACPGGISPAGAAHEQTVRQCGAEAILRYAVCAELTDFNHQSKSGVTAEAVRACGLVPASADTFMSREHITGNCGTMAVEMADVTFPIIEDGRNAMFSGAFVQLAWPGADFAPVTVKAGETGSLSLPSNDGACGKLGRADPPEAST